MIERRKFIHHTAVALGGAALAGCAPRTGQNGDCAQDAAANARRWKMVTTWPRDFPGLGGGARRLAEAITQMSGGRLTVTVYGANEFVPAFEVFDAVASGTAELGHGAAYYWKGKAPAAQLFGSVPFGMTATEVNGWLYYGGGLDLWREVYAPFGVVPYPAGNSGTQMGGWFKREIQTPEDLIGLKMRIPGLGGEVLQKVGGLPVNIPGGDLYTAIQTGAIDALEWVGPWNDLSFGLQQAARFYYYPGWQEPGSILECIVNRQALEQLPDDLQMIVSVACQAITQDMQAEFASRNAQALTALTEEHGVELRSFPPAVIEALKKAAGEVLAELATRDPLAAKVLESYRAFERQVRPWTAVSEQAYRAI